MKNRNIHLYPAHALLDEAVNEFFGNVFSNTKAVAKYPLTDIYTTENQAHFEIAVAGFSKDDIKIELVDDSIRIVGEVSKETTDENKEYIKKDIAKRSFDVAYSLMFPVEDIDAEIVDGVLKIDVTPANIRKETKQIDIK